MITKINGVNYRIKRYPKGWVIERQTYFLFFKYWKHAVSVSGIPSEPWYYSFYRFAKWDLDRIKEGYTTGLKMNLV
jgi:hypothetical protein